MLKVRSISVYQFKNYASRNFAFPERINGICGNNGVGKTNLLDAIHYLCFTRSYFTRLDSNSTQQGKSGFRIEGEFELQDHIEKAVCVLRENGKKEFSVNGRLYEKLSQHIGRYPCVVIAPDDAVLITGSSDERRKFVDSLLSQLDQEYLRNLIIYSKTLQQRNSLLKSMAETNSRDYALLEVLDEQMIRPGQYIFDKRAAFFVGFLPQVKHLYSRIAMQPEDITLFYESQLLQSSFQGLFENNRQKDFAACRTTAGIHRDDLEISLGDHPFRNIASQGQRKSLLFALKLAELEILKREKKFSPLLLLDDVFEKLDESRISNLLQRVCVENDGQVFITDTNEKRLREHLDVFGQKYGVCSL